MTGITITIMASKKAKVAIPVPAVIKFGFVEFKENTGTQKSSAKCKTCRTVITETKGG